MSGNINVNKCSNTLEQNLSRYLEFFSFTLMFYFLHLFILYINRFRNISNPVIYLFINNLFIYLFIYLFDYQEL